MTLGNQCTLHSFLQSPQCPINLLGRNLLQTLRAQILVHPHGSQATFSNNEKYFCTDVTDFISFAMRVNDAPPGNLPSVDIFWGLVIDKNFTPLGTTFNNCFSHIRTRNVLAPPPDPLHVTLFYYPDGDLTYQF